MHIHSEFTDQETTNSITEYPWPFEGGDEFEVTIPGSFIASNPVGPITVEVIIGTSTVTAPVEENIEISDEIVIDMLSPSSGGPGHYVGITGTGFSETLADNIVTFATSSGSDTFNSIGAAPSAVCQL